MFGTCGRQFLAELAPQIDEAGRSLSEVEQIDAHLAASEKELAQLSRRGRWCASVDLLRTMPLLG